MVRELGIGAVAAGSEQSLSVVVLFTTMGATRGALRAAVRLAEGLGARIRVVVPYVVPYPLDVEAPPVELPALLRGLCVPAGVACVIDIRLCRDRREGIGEAIPAGSLVMVGGGPRWWEFGERRLHAQLRRAGNQVVCAAGGDRHV